MKARIDKGKCVGCGICANICPKGIEMVDGKACIKDENASCLVDAANSCPRNAIVLIDRKKEEEIETNFNQEYGKEIEQEKEIAGGRGLSLDLRGNRGWGFGKGSRRRKRGSGRW